MKATIDIPLQGLELLEKPKQKMTMIVPGGGMMGCDSRNMIVTRGRPVGHDVLAYAAPRAKKIYSLDRALQRGAILLHGHVDKKELPIFEGDVSYPCSSGGMMTSMILDGVGGRFVDAAGDQGVTLLRELKKRLLLHTIPGDRKFVLRGVRTDRGEGVVIDAHFESAFAAVMGPPVSLEPVAAAPSAPARKELLTAVMKKKLMDRDGKPAKPIFKIFDPGGAGTWLLCSLEPDGDTLWAVCDLGFGCVEYGTVSLEELETARSQSFNLHMERDKYFAGAGMSVSALTSLSSLQQWQEVKS
jgi:hypothetical protein